MSKNSRLRFVILLGFGAGNILFFWYVLSSPPWLFWMQVNNATKPIRAATPALDLHKIPSKRELAPRERTLMGQAGNHPRIEDKEVLTVRDRHKWASLNVVNNPPLLTQSNSRIHGLKGKQELLTESQDDDDYFWNVTHNVNTGRIKTPDMDRSSLFIKSKPGGESEKCPDLLTGMTRGRWVRRSLTSHEQAAIDQYLREERGAYRIQPTYQRQDGRCGDVPYERSPLYNHMWFRAICDPKGETPCCFTNRCVDRSEEDCRCATCFDERQAIHAEFAQWKPEDPRCHVTTFTSTEACELLRGSTLYFVGDSFVRHVFAALAIVLTGNTVDGALKQRIRQGHACEGMHQITGLTCRELLDTDRSVCHDTVKVGTKPGSHGFYYVFIKYIQVFPAKEFQLTPPMLRSLRHVNKSVVILGLGIHDNFNVEVVTRKFLLPFLNLHQIMSTNVSANLDLRNVMTDFGNISTIISALKSGDGNLSSVTSTGRHYENLLEDDLLQILKPLYFNKLAVAGVGTYQKFLQANPLTFLKAQGKKPGYIKETNPKITVPVKKETIIFKPFPKANIDALKLWPRLLWLGTHAPGLLKSPKFKQQTARGVQDYNEGSRKILERWQVPFMDTFNISDGVVSFDGTHYGWGVNMLKVNMILSYIQANLRGREGWDKDDSLGG